MVVDIPINCCVRLLHFVPILSKLVSDYDLAGDEIVSCGPDYIRLHAHH